MELTQERRDELAAKKPEDLTEAEKTELSGPSMLAPAITTAMGDGAAPNQAVTEQSVCGICSKDIKSGDRVTTETVNNEVTSWRRLVHVDCQLKRAEEDRVGDPEADEVEEKPLTEAQRKAKDEEIARKNATTENGAEGYGEGTGSKENEPARSGGFFNR